MPVDNNRYSKKATKIAITSIILQLLIMNTSSLHAAASPDSAVRSAGGRIEYHNTCAKLQLVLVQSCSALVNNDGSLTSKGDQAMQCVRNALLLGSSPGVPLSDILNGLSMLAPPPGCDGILQMQAFSQLGNISSLNSITRLHTVASSSSQTDKKSSPISTSINTKNSTASTQSIKTKIFDLTTVNGLTFPIRYAVTGNGSSLHHMSYSDRYIDTQSQSMKNGGVLSMIVDSLSNGKLIIEVPRGLVNSPQVVVGGALVPAQETTSNSKVRTLVVDFHKGSPGIEIQDKTPLNNNNLMSGSQISALSRPLSEGNSMSE